MNKEQIKELADFIFESEENVTFPLLLAKINMMGVEVKGEEDFTSGCIKNCIYWKGISKEAIEVLRDIEKFYNVVLQPYGFNQEGVKLYKSWYPDMPIFNHLLIDKMTPKRVYGSALHDAGLLGSSIKSEKNQETKIRKGEHGSLFFA